MHRSIESEQGGAILTEEAGLSVTHLGVSLGAQISGADLRQRLADEVVRAIEKALVDNEVIVFRNQEITSEHLLDFGRRFGELTVHPFSPNEASAPQLIKFRNDETKPPFATDVWHSDETFRAEPPMATVLCAKEVPASVEDRKTLQRFELMYPPQVHPVVRVHPVSGRKVLFVNPQFTIAIKDMDERESRALLDTLFHQALIPEYQFRHHWAAHTIAMWDNRSTQHYAVNDYYPQRRYMERVTIRGGPVIGVARVDPASPRKAKIRLPDHVDRHGGHKPQGQ